MSKPNTPAPRRLRNRVATAPILRKGGAHLVSRKRERQAVSAVLRREGW